MTKNVSVTSSLDELKFKLEFNEEEKITPYAGLSIYGEMYKSLGLDKEVKGLFPVPGSGKGFKANSYVNSLVMMFVGGGKYVRWKKCPVEMRLEIG